MDSLAKLKTIGLLLVAAGCDKGKVDPRQELLHQEHEIAVAELEMGVRQLKASGEDILEDMARAKTLFLQAQSRRDEANSLNAKSQKSLTDSRLSFQQAEAKWRYYQVLVEVAAQVDANNLEKFRATTGARNVRSLNCEDGMSTSAFRRELSRQGKNIAGMDVDHIVPRSLGGADHPANYQLLPSSVNRSIGAQWDATKCLAARGQCAGAVAISRKCGTFRGTGF